MKTKNPSGNRLSITLAPDCYNPKTPNELIGHARAVAQGLLRTLAHRAGNLKMLLYGTPGNGKTSILNMLARAVAGHNIDIESLNGRNVTIELIREWQRNAAFSSLFGGWKVKVINEVDLVSPVVQDLMLTYLDELPAQTAVIAASNQNVTALTERFQTRFRLVQVESPRDHEISRWLVQRWRIPKATADFISLGVCGNVRQALLDAADFMTFGQFNEHRPKAPIVLKDPMRQEAARKAWDTARTAAASKAAA